MKKYQRLVTKYEGEIDEIKNLKASLVDARQDENWKDWDALNSTIINRFDNLKEEIHIEYEDTPFESIIEQGIKRFFELSGLVE